MVTKQYLFWVNENIYAAPATRTVTVDQWGSISSAVLSWTVNGTSGFNNLQLNGKTVSTAKTGSQDVAAYLQQGQKNSLVLNYQSSFQTVVLGQAAGNANAILTVTGNLAATLSTILAQNTEFLSAVQNSQISQAQYNAAIAFQNQQLQQLLALGQITQTQYNAAIAAETIPASSSTPSSTNSNPSPAPTSSGNNGFISASADGTTPTILGLPWYVWLIAAGAAILIIFLVLNRERL